MKYIEVDPMSNSWVYWYPRAKIPELLNNIFVVRLVYLLKGHPSFIGDDKIIKYTFWKWYSKETPICLDLTKDLTMRFDK